MPTRLRAPLPPSPRRAALRECSSRFAQRPPKAVNLLPNRLLRELPRPTLHACCWLLAAIVTSVAAQPRGDADRKSKPAAERPAAKSADRPPPKATAGRQRELQSEQQELKRELAKLKRQLMAAEANQEDAADALAASEASISVSNRRLRELARERAQVESQIANLRDRRSTVATQEGSQEKRLNQIIRQQYALTLIDPFPAFLAGADPAQLGRDAEYLRYAGRGVALAIDELQSRRAELNELEERSREKSEILRDIASDEERVRASLINESARQKQTFERLRRQIAAQRQSIEKLERDEKRLTNLIDQVSRVLAEQSRRDAQRRAEQSARAAAAAARKPREETPNDATVERSPAVPPTSGVNFGQLRGKMLLPVNGEITARYGSPRRVEGAGTAPTWKGLFIRAPLGTEVRSVAAGQVVFADWLRGFGNLMVIDHGEGYLSVYGNNESLLRNVGDSVAVGDGIASVGNTGGNEQTGLYFELRFQGRPFDPLRWVAAR